jgi:RNA recognition motif-containing protein
MSERSLRELFSPYGTVTDLQFEVSADGQCLGIAELRMIDSDEAEAAIKGLHRLEVNGKRMLVFRIPPHSSQESPREP